MSQPSNGTDPANEPRQPVDPAHRSPDPAHQPPGNGQPGERGRAAEAGRPAAGSGHGAGNGQPAAPGPGPGPAGPATRPASARSRWAIYIGAGVVVLALVIVGLITFRHHERDDTAEAKADELISALNRAGLTPPDKDQIVRVLGDDGGVMCENPGSALRQAIANQVGSNGAAGPGQRPGPVAAHAVQAEILAIQIYCPDELPDFMNYVNGLDLEDLDRT